MSAGERHELSDLLDAASQRVNRLEAANVHHGNREASLKDKVGPACCRTLRQMHIATCNSSFTLMVWILQQGCSTAADSLFCHGPGAKEPPTSCFAFVHIPTAWLSCRCQQHK